MNNSSTARKVGHGIRNFILAIFTLCFALQFTLELGEHYLTTMFGEYNAASNLQDKFQALEYLGELKGELKSIKETYSTMELSNVTEKYFQKRINSIVESSNGNCYLKDFKLTYPSGESISEICDELISQIDSEILSIRTCSGEENSGS